MPTNRRVEITLERTRGFEWARAERAGGPGVRAHAVGYAVDSGRAIDSAGIAERFAQMAGGGGDLRAVARGATALVRELPGGCAVVIESPGGVVALTDYQRSFPLYYGEAGGAVVVSDDADVVRRRLGATQIDDEAIGELMLTGFVTGADTAVRGVRQMLSGQCITWDTSGASGGGPRMHAERHYVFEPNGPDADEAETEQRVWGSLEVAFERFIASTAGRRIAVPLSGGCDARTVACMLARHGRTDALLFTYGSPRHFDVVRAEETARVLGMRWVYVPYTQRFVRAAARPEATGPLMRYVDGLTATTHFQDWPAITELMRRGEIEAGDVIVPGHVSIIHGAHVPARFMGRGTYTRDEVIDHVLWKYYGELWDWRMRAYELRSKLERRVSSRLIETAGEGLSGAQASRAVESWEWQERQAKYLLNSVRVYEYLGLQWRLPLCDPDWARVLGDAPMGQRFERRLYWSMLDRRLLGPMGVGIERIERAEATWRPRGAWRAVDAVGRRLLRVLPLHERAVVERLCTPGFGRMPVLDYPRLLSAYIGRFGWTPRVLEAVTTVTLTTFLAQRDMIRRTTDPAYDTDADT